MILGETKTGLLQNSTSVSLPFSAELLLFRPDVGTTQSERPLALATSADLLTGIDCSLPSTSGSKVEAIGTVASRASIVGGTIVQGTAYTELVPAVTNRQRMPWSHYLANLGTIEVAAKFRSPDVMAGFLDFEAHADGSMAIGAIAERVIDRVQQHPRINHRAPFRARRTSMRWVLMMEEAIQNTEVVGGMTEAHFRLEGQANRGLVIYSSKLGMADCVRLCESIAYHDWLLSTLLRRMDPGGSAATGSTFIDHVRPMLEYLIHLWMPKAHISSDGGQIWDGFEKSIGFSKQWDTAVEHIRDLMFVNLTRALSELKPELGDYK
jgi:hypothetical protein